VHRLGRFAEAHPDIDLRISATMHHVDFAGEDVDIAVRHGEGSWPSLDVTRLGPEHLFPVMSPKLLTGRTRIRTPRDILRFPLIHIGDRQSWASWLDAVGVEDVTISQGPILNRDSMAIDAAVDGQGVVLARATLASWDLLSGRLVMPVAASLKLHKTYWIVSTKAAASLPKIAAFRSWLLREVAADQRRLRKLTPQAKR